ncbi:2-oxo-hept-4-ene-1,7-dioate hydratase [Tabrizicola oligotrophica]|uniref:2-oxo-hepta-3-ene-1,7-dioic acid hydratase n=1 Tax=Tabrizicola oligotrophica TaxID=2710650 RepID=A0A6M0QWB0_9RHOB|nr:2-oxo-hepta-3-ene-1,7-dioic acid hydratase [Tabrizicola oligotrophica]NEY91697.1 2-oxo-hepta-3-ene-1,7-dioic acid hydratase [Tabrizicola oligotrophica]
MSVDWVAKAGNSLFQAEQSRVQRGLLSAEHPEATMDDAYAVQRAFVDRKLAAGRRIIGWKIGLTSRAMQQQLNITTPDSGVLLDDMAFSSGDTIPAGRFIAPRIEAEIAFIMKTPLQGDVTREQVLAATAHVAPALEILDTRIVRTQAGKTRTIIDTISDNAANAGIVTGSQRHDPALDLRWVGAIVKRDGVVEETGLGAGVLDDPVTGIIWLARRMGQYGQRIEPGQIILSGSFIRAMECPSGSHIDADFGPFGHLTCTFA